MLGLTNTSFLQFFYFYLWDRKQFVRYIYFASYVYFASSGLPQGLNLSPVLFNCFVNNLLERLSCGIVLCRWSERFFWSISALTDCLSLQRDVHRSCGQNVKKKIWKTNINIIVWPNVRVITVNLIPFAL